MEYWSAFLPGPSDYKCPPAAFTLTPLCSFISACPVVGLQCVFLKGFVLFNIYLSLGSPHVCRIRHHRGNEIIQHKLLPFTEQSNWIITYVCRKRQPRMSTSINCNLTYWTLDKHFGGSNVPVLRSDPVCWVTRSPRLYFTPFFAASFIFTDWWHLAYMCAINVIQYFISCVLFGHWHRQVSCLHKR